MPKHQFHSTNSRPDTKTCPQIDLLGLNKMHGNVKTEYALKQPLGGPRDAWLCINISEAVFTVPLSEGC